MGNQRLTPPQYSIANREGFDMNNLKGMPNASRIFLYELITQLQKGRVLT